MAVSQTMSPNGKWRRPSQRQRPPTPSVRLQEEAGCHNDLASAVPAGRPMMSTISNTFADYSIDDEEEEESSSVEEEDDAGDGEGDDGDAYVIQVRPLPKIRLDLCPAPREEDEYRDQNRKSSRRRRSSRDTSSSPSKTSPSKSKESQKDSGASVDLTSSTLNSSLASTISTDKDGNNESLDTTKDAAGLLPRRQNEQPQHASMVGKVQETSQGAALTDVDADGFPVITSFGESSNEHVVNTRKEELPKDAQVLFAPSPSPALAIYHDKSSTELHGSERLSDSNWLVAPSSANEKRKHTDAREEDESQASPTAVADIEPASSPHRPSTGGKYLHRVKDRPSKDEHQRTSPASSTEGRQEDDRRRRRRKGTRRRKDEERSVDDSNDHDDDIHEADVDEKEGPSIIFDWLLMICGDVSSFVSEGMLGIDGDNSRPSKQGGNELRSHEDPAKTRRSRKKGGMYDLDHFKW